MALPNAGKTWQFDFAADKAGVVIRIGLAESYNSETGQHMIAITDLQAKGTKGKSWYGFSYFLDGNISIKGIDQKIITFTKSSWDHYFWWGSLDTFEPVRAQHSPVTSPLNWESESIQGDNISVSLVIRGYTASGQYGSGWEVSETMELVLTATPDVPSLDTEPVRSDPNVGFYFNGQRVFPRYADRLIGAFIKPVTIDPSEAVLGTAVLGTMILGKEP